MLVLFFMLVMSMFMNSIEALSLLCVSLLLMVGFNYKTFMLVEDSVFQFSNISLLLSLMTVMLVVVSLISTYEMSKGWFYKNILLMLLVVLISCFTINNLMLFYILFEMSLIPMLMIIITWGYQPERLQAGLYMILYTVFGSLPLLVLILLIYKWCFTMNISLLLSGSMWPSMDQDIMKMMVLGMFAFLIKLPIYSFHLWLPKAHVEAPLAGSMLLAGVLLKLGGYGIYLWSSLWYPGLLSVMWILLGVISLWGGVLTCVICMSQSDIKSMIAYSSIVHMSIIVFGFLSNTSWGFMGSTLVMIAHGFTSSCLFLLAYFTYSKVGTRMFLYTKGMLMCFPVLSMLWFFNLCINMSAPPSINFLSELMVIPSINMVSTFVLIMMATLMFLSVGYNMYMYMQINHGNISPMMNSSKYFNSKFYLVTLLHMLPLILLFKSVWF